VARTFCHWSDQNAFIPGCPMTEFGAPRFCADGFPAEGRGGVALPPARTPRVLHQHAPGAAASHTLWLLLSYSYLPSLLSQTSLSSPDLKIGPQLLGALSDILHFLPASVFRSDRASGPLSADVASDDPLPHALSVYISRSDAQPVAEPDYQGFSGPMLLRVTLDGLLAASGIAARASEYRGDVLVAILGLVEHLLAKVERGGAPIMILRWQPDAWLAMMAEAAQTVRQSVVAANLKQYLTTVSARAADCVLLPSAASCGHGARAGLGSVSAAATGARGSSPADGLLKSSEFEDLGRLLE
jgi:hypothetical protein